MGDFRVEISQLDTVNGVFRLQTGHMTKVQSYVQTNCNAHGGFSGLAVKPLQGHYDRAYQIADTGTGQGKTIAEHCTTTLNGTKSEYLRQDRAAYDKMAAQMRKAGQVPPPYKPPGAGPAPARGASIKPGDAPGKTMWDQTKTGISETTKAAGYADKARGLGPFGKGLEAPKPPEYPDNLDPAKWRDYAVAKRLYDGSMNRRDDRTALEHNQRNTGGNDSWTREDAARVREEGYVSGRQTARDDMWNRVDWAEADRRNGADTTGNSSYTANDMRTEREATWNRPAPTDRHGETWDGNKTAGAFQKAIGLPGTLISTGEGIVTTIQQGQQADALAADVRTSAQGPSNNEAINWTNGTGGTW